NTNYDPGRPSKPSSTKSSATRDRSRMRRTTLSPNAVGTVETRRSMSTPRTAILMRPSCGSRRSAMSSLPPLMRWLLQKLKTVPQLPDTSLPTWITKAEDYQRKLFDFDAPSKIVVLRIAYYTGECFVRNFPDLVWSVGGADTALKNIPVVSGF